jgi:hypothetical protein
VVDVITILAGALGVGVGLGAAYLGFYSRPGGKKVSMRVRDDDGSLRSVSVTSAELDRSRREMRTMMVERDLLSSALMKVYEAESEGRITTEEREMIAKRYSDQIKGMQSKLKDVELIVEVGELEKLREELVGLFREKIQNIETRLDAAKERLGPAAPEPVPRKESAPRAEKEPDLEKVVQRRSRPEVSEADRRVRELRDEVMDALTKLEQIDIDKNKENA